MSSYVANIRKQLCVPFHLEKYHTQRIQFKKRIPFFADGSVKVLIQKSIYFIDQNCRTLQLFITKSLLCIFSGYLLFLLRTRGFTGESVVENIPTNAGDSSSIPGWGRFPWKRKWQPMPVFLPGKSHGQRRQVGYSPWGHKQ